MKTCYSRTGMVALLAAVLAATACSGEKKAADTTAAAAARTDTSAGARMDTTKRDTTAAAKGTWSDAAIVAFAEAANNGEYKDNLIAERKAKAAPVKAFARQMVTDHKAMLADTKSLATKLKIAPDTTNGDVRDLTNHANDEAKDLTNNKAGADWDKDYIGKQVADHQTVLGKLQDAAKSTSNTELRAALEKATAKVQEHLTKAQDIQAKLK